MVEAKILPNWNSDPSMCVLDAPDKSSGFTSDDGNEVGEKEIGLTDGRADL